MHTQTPSYVNLILTGGLSSYLVPLPFYYLFLLSALPLALAVSFVMYLLHVYTLSSQSE